MEESEILGLNNAYREKYEADFVPSTLTFVSESELISKYLEQLCAYTLSQEEDPRAVEIKHRLVFFVSFITEARNIKSSLASSTLTWKAGSSLLWGVCKL
jgi:hypothetical protein